MSLYKKISDLCVSAAKNKNLLELKQLSYAFGCLNKNEMFNELVFSCRFEALPNSIFEDFVENFSLLKEILKNEINLFKEILFEPAEAINEFISSCLNKIDMSQVTKQISSETMLEFHSQITEFAGFLKHHCSDLKSITELIRTLPDYLSAEKSYFDSVIKTSSRPITLDS
jgi:hypothetical protein